MRIMVSRWPLPEELVHIISPGMTAILLRPISLLHLACAGCMKVISCSQMKEQR